VRLSVSGGAQYFLIFCTRHSGEDRMAKNEEFLIQITSRHEDLNDSFKAYIQKQLYKLNKYYPSIIDAKVIIDKENNAHYRVDISVQIPGAFLTGKETGYDYPKAFDAALGKVKIQVKKHRERITDHKPRQATELERTEAPVESEENE
jgi:putative sigma-54 modulation protein